MKTILLNIIFLITFSCIIAQNTEVESIPKNYVGINFGGVYSRSELKTSSQTKLILTAAPFYGRRVKRFVFGIGTSLGYNNNKTSESKYDGTKIYYTTDKSNEIILLPTIRYYTKFNLFLAGSFNIGKGSGENSNPIVNGRNVYYYNVDNSSNIIGFSLGVGYAIKAGKSFFIEPQISIQKTYYEIYYKSYTSAPSIFYNNYKYSIKREYLNLLIGLGTVYRF